MVEKILKIINKYKLSDEIRYKLLQIDAYANLHNITDSIDFFADEHSVNKTKIFFPYIIEKFIVYSKKSGKKRIENTELNKIFNIANQLGGNMALDENEPLTYEKLFYLLDKEQIRFQDKNYNILRYRYLTLFKNNTISEKIIKEIFKMDLDKFIFISYLFVTYISIQKKVSIKLNIETFKFSINKINVINNTDIDNFLDYISISKENFIKKYETLRKEKLNENNNFLSKEILNKSDKYLPKISFYYPLIKENQEYYFTSFTAITEFLKFERVFTEIAENNSTESNYRDKILGKILIEEYTRNEAKFFNDNLDIKGKVYGGAEYKINGNKFDEPDVIYEFEDYIIFIECKNSISHLIHTINNFEPDKLKKRIGDDLNKSIKNINRFLDYKLKLKAKEHYKILMYFNSTPISTTSLKFDLFKNSDFILSDISSIEALFRVKNNKLNNIIEDYIKNQKLESLYDYLHSKYTLDNSREEEILNNYKNYFSENGVTK